MVNRWLFWIDSEVTTFPDPGMWSIAVGDVPMISVKGIFNGFGSTGVDSVAEASCAVVEDLDWAPLSVEDFWVGTSSIVEVSCGAGSSAPTGRLLVNATISARPVIIMLVPILNFKNDDLFTRFLLARWALMASRGE